MYPAIRPQRLFESSRVPPQPPSCSKKPDAVHVLEEFAGSYARRDFSGPVLLISSPLPSTIKFSQFRNLLAIDLRRGESQLFFERLLQM